MKSVVDKLNTIKFSRIRIGVGSPRENEDLANYILKKLTNKEKETLEKSIEIANKVIIEILKNGVDSAMNIYNHK